MCLKLPDVSRREFVKTGGIVLGGLATAVQGATDTDQSTPKVPQVVLGRTGASVGRLGIGCAYFQRQRVTPDDVRATLHRCVELGVNYLDTAPNYGSLETGYAEEKMGAVIPEIRDKVFLVTKTESPTYEGTWDLLRRSLKRMKTERIDLVHLHNFGEVRDWGDRKAVFGPKGAMGALREAKKQGIVRFIGASGHNHPAHFHVALDSGEIDVLMNAVNFVTRHTYNFEHKLWSRAHHDNLGLVAMKVLGGAASQEKGSHLIPPEHYESALRYVLSVTGLSVVVVGMETIAEVEKAARTVATARPLSPKEGLDLARLGLELSARPNWQAPYGTPLT